MRIAKYAAFHKKEALSANPSYDFYFRFAKSTLPYCTAHILYARHSQSLFDMLVIPSLLFDMFVIPLRLLFGILVIPFNLPHGILAYHSTCYAVYFSYCSVYYAVYWSYHSTYHAVSHMSYRAEQLCCEVDRTRFLTFAPRFSFVKKIPPLAVKDYPMS